MDVIDEYIHYVNCKHDLYELCRQKAGLYACPLISPSWIIKNIKIKTKHTGYLLDNPRITVADIINLLSMLPETNLFHISRVLTYDECMQILTYDKTQIYCLLKCNENAKVWQYILSKGLHRDTLLLSAFAPPEYIEANIGANWHLGTLLKRTIPLDIIEPLFPDSNSIDSVIAKIDLNKYYTQIQLGLPWCEPHRNYTINEYNYHMVAQYPELDWCYSNISTQVWEKLIPVLRTVIDQSIYSAWAPSHLIATTPDEVESLDSIIDEYNITSQTAEMMILHDPSNIDAYQYDVSWEFIKSHPDLNWDHVYMKCPSIAEYIAIFGTSHIHKVIFEQLDYNDVPAGLECVIFNNTMSMEALNARIATMRNSRKLGLSIHCIKAYSDVKIEFQQ